MAIEEMKKLGISVSILFFIIILLVVSALVAEEFRSVKPTFNSSFINYNESTTPSYASNISRITLANAWCVSNSFVVTNETSGASISSGNYTVVCNTTESSIIFTTAGAAGDYNGTFLNVTYNYKLTAASYYYNITTEGLNSFQNISKQSPLLGTIIILILIAGVALGIFAYFNRGKKGGQF